MRTPRVDTLARPIRTSALTCGDSRTRTCGRCCGRNARARTSANKEPSPSRAAALFFSAHPAGELRGLPDPLRHLYFVELAVADVDVAHVFLFGCAWRQRL